MLVDLEGAEEEETEMERDGGAEDDAVLLEGSTENGLVEATDAKDPCAGAGRLNKLDVSISIEGYSNA